MIPKGPPGNLEKEFFKLHLKEEMGWEVDFQPDGTVLKLLVGGQALFLTSALCLLTEGILRDFLFSRNWLYHRHNEPEGEEPRLGREAGQTAGTISSATDPPLHRRADWIPGYLPRVTESVRGKKRQD